MKRKCSGLVLRGASRCQMVHIFYKQNKRWYSCFMVYWDSDWKICRGEVIIPSRPSPPGTLLADFEKKYPADETNIVLNSSGQQMPKSQWQSAGIENDKWKELVGKKKYKNQFNPRTLRQELIMNDMASGWSYGGMASGNSGFCIYSWKKEGKWWCSVFEMLSNDSVWTGGAYVFSSEGKTVDPLHSFPPKALH